MINRGSKYYGGNKVVLSTGILNAVDWINVENQLIFLRDSNAIVEVVGTPFSSYNQRLSALCNKYGFKFLGGYTPGPDGIHPTSYVGLY